MKEAIKRALKYKSTPLTGNVLPNPVVCTNKNSQNPPTNNFLNV